MEARSSEPPKLFRNKPNVEAHRTHNRIPEGTRVRLKDTAERYIAVMTNSAVNAEKMNHIKSEGIVGSVTDNFYENKTTGDHKYKVKFDVLGSFGVKLSDLEFV